MLQAGMQSGEQQPPALFGSVSEGQIKLAPLHTPSEMQGPPPNPDPSNKRLGVAVVGLGHLSLEQILPGFGQAKHVRVTALVSGERDKAQAVAAQYNLPEKNIYDYRGFDGLKKKL